MKPTKPKIIIDCDPGADDFFALIWALGLHKKRVIDIIAITTVGGNVGANLTYTNALRACQFMGIFDIPVGKTETIVAAKDASHIHGKDGLGDASRYLPPVKMPKKVLSSTALLSQLVKKYPEVQIITTGPLTNIAGLIKKKVYPGRVVAMGGAIHVPGNVTPNAEFNIAYDPISADIVFGSTVPVILLPLDVTTKLIFTKEEFKAMKLGHASRGEKASKKLGANKVKFLEALIDHTIQTNMAFRETAGVPGLLVHDASTVAMLVYPNLFRGQLLPMRVETKGNFTRGQTVSDLRNVANLNTHTFVALEVDKARFMEAMIQDFISFFQ